MRYARAVIFPLVVQLLAFVGVMYVSLGDGSFVGLGALSGIVGVAPVTTLINWLHAYWKPPAPMFRLLATSYFICLIVPALLLWLRAIEAKWI